MREHRNPDDTLKWVRRGSALAALVIGWVFILVMNHFHVTPPVVFVCLGYFAAVSAIYTLYRTGATAVTDVDESDDQGSWGRPIGELSELEREKRTLLKAIKEAEFDQQMGKLSKSDADAMIAVYRARAIEVIKEIDIQNSTSGKAGSVRDRILREARARIHVEEKASEGRPKKKDKGNDKQKARADKLADAVGAAKAKVEDKPADVKVEDKPADVKVEDKPADVKVEDKPADVKVEETPAAAASETSTPEESGSKEAAR